MSVHDIYLVISPHMIDNCRREGAVLLLSSDDVGVDGRKGEMVDCECAGVSLLRMYVWYVSHCCVYLCVWMCLYGYWVGMCLIVYF